MNRLVASALEALVLEEGQAITAGAKAYGSRCPAGHRASR